MSGRVIGLDPGERRIGVAVSDPTGTIATPLRYIDTVTESVEDVVGALCSEYDPQAFVVGLPINLDGSEGRSARMARDLGTRVSASTGIPVEYQDERFTSHTAEVAMLSDGVKRRKRKEKRDQIAAAVMLQTWLDRQNNDGINEPT